MTCSQGPCDRWERRTRLHGAVETGGLRAPQQRERAVGRLVAGDREVHELLVTHHVCPDNTGPEHA